MQTQYYKVNQIYKFNDGFAVVKTRRIGLKNGKEYPKVAILDLETFLEVFEQGNEFADLLENRANDLAVKWNNKNQNVPPYLRTPECRKFTLNTYNWINQFDVQEKSTIEVCISSGGFTKLSLEREHAEIQVKDLKITIKLKSTVKESKGHNQEPCLKLTSRGVGYTAPFHHFIGLLRDPVLKAAIEHCRFLKDVADNDKCAV